MYSSCEVTYRMFIVDYPNNVLPIPLIQYVMTTQDVQN